MAGDSLIDQYIHAFAVHVRGRRDCADLVDEVDDHLRTSIERLEVLGIDRETAERRALARFGEPRLVASLIMAVPSKGSIMSLFFSRHLRGVVATAAALWLVAGAFSYWGLTDANGAWNQTSYLIASSAVILACLATTAALVGVNLRTVGEFDGATKGIVALGLAATVASLITWAIGVWLSLLIAAVIWTLARSLAARAGSKAFSAVLLVLMAALGIAALAATGFGLLTETDTGYLSWAILLGLLAVMVAGLVDAAVRLGRRAGRVETVA